MKKTVSMLLAVIVAAVAICTLATSVFAAPEVPTDPRYTTTTTTTEATTVTTTTTTEASTTATTAATTEASTAATTESSTGTTVAATTESTTEEIVTRKPGETVIDEGETTTTTKATTKKPAAVVGTIPSTGSSVAIPVIALLALAASTAAVVKTKKDN